MDRMWSAVLGAAVGAVMVFVSVWVLYAAYPPISPSLCMAYGEWVGQSGQHATAMERLCVEAGR